jgi:hypothetical protein
MTRFRHRDNHGQRDSDDRGRGEPPKPAAAAAAGSGDGIVPGRYAAFPPARTGWFRRLGCAVEHL